MNVYRHNGNTKKSLQFSDVSFNVFYDQTLAENKLLSMINACISHELRNPLNSIVAQNTLKAVLYEEMEKLILSDEPMAKEK